MREWYLINNPILIPLAIPNIRGWNAVQSSSLCKSICGQVFRKRWKSLNERVLHETLPFFLAPRGHISNSLICCAMYTLCCLEASVAPMKPFFKPDTLSANWKIIPFGNVWSFWLQNKVHSRTSTAAHNMYFTRHREKLDRVVQVEFSILRRICVRRKRCLPFARKH